MHGAGSFTGRFGMTPEIGDCADSAVCQHEAQPRDAEVGLQGDVEAYNPAIWDALLDSSLPKSSSGAVRHMLT